ncbi:MAG: hypothetical protein MI867_28420 [Pseudomonadales bacterium]|nr:hypothetical protein [Pseudomonadales bacterium]
MKVFFLLITSTFLSLAINLEVFASGGFSDTRFSGFATVGFARGGNQQVGLRQNVTYHGEYANWSHKTDSLVGVQASSRWNEQWGSAIQLVFRDRVGESFEDNITWAYLRFNPTSSVSLRAGRMGADLFMLSEYRNTGFAYLWVRPPIEFYGFIGFEHYEGLDVSYKLPLGVGMLSAKLMLGKSSQQLVNDDLDINFKVDPAYGFNLRWETDSVRLHFSHSELSFDSSAAEEFRIDELLDALTLAQTFGWSELGPIINSLDIDNKSIAYTSVGFAYDVTPWVMQTEIAYIASDFDVFKPYLNYYFSAGYKVGDFTFYSMVARAENTKDPNQAPVAPNIPVIPGFPSEQIQAVVDEFSSSIQSFYVAVSIEQTTYSVGTRWNLRHNTALKFQWDCTFIDAVGKNLWETKSRLHEDQRVNTYSINLDFVF